MSVKNKARAFFSLKRMIMLSIVFSVGFHLLYMLALFFGESLFFSIEKSPTTQRYISPKMPQSSAIDTIQFGEKQQFNPARPRPPKDFGDTKVNPRRLRIGKVVVHVLLSFVLVFALFVYNRRMMALDFSKKWREIFFVILGSLLITTVLSIIFYLLIWALDPLVSGPPFPFPIIRDYLVRGYFLMAVVILNCYLLRSLYRQRAIAIENEELRTENIRSHYEALKSQLDPHFLFNSMNTLQSLIDIDPSKASDYVQQLSTVLRYTLQSKEVVTLAEEMKCVHDYCSMMQVRYGDNLRFDIRMDKNYDNAKVLPFAVQGLVENAIKHNVISAKQPFVIQIFTTDNDELEIRNVIQPKHKMEADTGIGLANLAERYRLQWDKDVVIRDDGKTFCVTIPLIINKPIMP